MPFELAEDLMPPFQRTSPELKLVASSYPLVNAERHQAYSNKNLFYLHNQLYSPVF